jgi:hypothetical protein
MLAAKSGSGSEKPQSAYGLCTVFLRHILPALVLLRKPLLGLAKRHIQPNVMCNWAKINWEYIDKIKILRIQ